MMNGMKPFRTWCEDNGFGATTGYKMAKEKKVFPVKVGKLTMITPEEDERFRKSLPAYQPAHAAGA